MNVPSPDPRQQAILASALQAFATYGFRKTSMDDIARGAGMSRPALYLHYRNKEAILRSLTAQYYDDKFHTVRAALEQPGSVAEQLGRAMSAQVAGMELLLTSPHGMELLDVSTSTAPDIVAEGETGMSAIYAAWLTREAEAGRVRLSGDAEAVAATITAALKGIKMTARDADAFKSGITQLAALIGAGLGVR